MLSVHAGSGVIPGCDFMVNNSFSLLTKQWIASETRTAIDLRTLIFNEMRVAVGSDLTGLVFVEGSRENLCLADGGRRQQFLFPAARRRYEILNAMIDSVIGCAIASWVTGRY